MADRWTEAMRSEFSPEDRMEIRLRLGLIAPVPSGGVQATEEASDG